RVEDERTEAGYLVDTSFQQPLAAREHQVGGGAAEEMAHAFVIAGGSHKRRKPGWRRSHRCREAFEFGPLPRPVPRCQENPVVQAKREYVKKPPEADATVLG